MIILLLHGCNYGPMASPTMHMIFQPRMRVVFALVVLLQFPCLQIICIIIILLEKNQFFSQRHRTEETNVE